MGIVNDPAAANMAQLRLNLVCGAIFRPVSA